MSNAVFPANLSKLDTNYQILTELDREAGSPIYLARHLGLNRDVTIAVVSSLSDHDAALTHLAADARLLTGMRHPNVIPIIEAMWLDARSFAIVRPRVRGSTLAQLIVSNGAVPIGTVATTIQQVHDTIAWARSQGVVHRRIAPSSVMFQQGNGRVFLAFEPTPLAGGELPDECHDAATIGILSSDMMLGRVTRGGQPVTAVTIPTPILPAVTRAIEAVRRCRPDNAPHVVAALLKALHAAARVEEADAAPADAPTVAVRPAHPVETLDAAPAMIADADVTEPAPLLPVRNSDVEAIAVVEPRFGFNARLGAAVAAAVIIGVLGLLSFRRQSSSPSLSASAVASDSNSQAAGEIAFGPSRADSARKGSASAQPPTRSSPTSIPSQPSAAKSATKPATVPPAAAARPASERSASGMNDGICRSPAAADQHRCLMDAIERNDGDLNDIYQKLIGALRRRSSAAAGDPDPDSVIRLRVSQRKWVDDRDAACRRVGSGQLYARERSSCFAQQSANRARELQRMLDAVPRDR